MIVIKIYKDGFYVGSDEVKISEVSKYENAGFRVIIR